MVPGRSLNKLVIRDTLFSSMQSAENKEKDYLIFSDMLNTPKIQLMIGAYLEHIQSKKK